MPFDPYRVNVKFDQSSQKNWVIKNGFREHWRNYMAQVDIGKDINPPRWPARPLDKGGFFIYLAAAQTMNICKAANYRKYAGIVMNSVFKDDWESCWETGGEAQFPVGSEAVTFGHMVMPDWNPQYGDYGTDVVRQWVVKPWAQRIKTAVTAAVNLTTGYAIGSTVISVDAISGVWGLQAGDTISITTGGTARYYLIKSISYLTSATALITLANPVYFALVDNDVITTAHAADAPVFLPADSPLFGKLKAILNAKYTVDAGGGGTTTTVFNQIETVVPPTAGVSVVPGTSLGFSETGGVGVYVHTALTTSAALLDIIAQFYDDQIYPFTIGKAVTSGVVRTGIEEGSFASVLVVMK